MEYIEWNIKSVKLHYAHFKKENKEFRACYLYDCENGKYKIIKTYRNDDFYFHNVTPEYTCNEIMAFITGYGMKTKNTLTKLKKV